MGHSIFVWSSTPTGRITPYKMIRFTAFGGGVFGHALAAGTPRSGDATFPESHPLHAAALHLESGLRGEAGTSQ